jgi:P-type Mg2+ transporter
LLVFKASPTEFQTAWFLESMVTQILVIFIIRTNGRPWRDFPNPALTASTLIALAGAMALPFTPAGRWFGFAAPPPLVLAGIGLVVVAYLGSAELLKRIAITHIAIPASPKP